MSTESFASQVFLLEIPVSVADELPELPLFLARETDKRMSGAAAAQARFFSPGTTGERLAALEKWSGFMLREALSKGPCHPALFCTELDAGTRLLLRDHFKDNLVEISAGTAEEVLHQFRMSKWNLGIIYHVACMGNWRNVVAAQLCDLRTSGLDGVYVSLLGTAADLREFEAMAEENRVEVAVFFRCANLDLYELPAIRFLESWARNNPGAYLIYFHSKGVSAPDDEIKRKWRALMQRCLIGRWRENVEALRRGADAVGVMWRNTPPVSHFPGNFFAATSNFIASLEDFSHYYRTPRHRQGRSFYRLAAEMWIGSSPMPARVHTWFSSEFRIGTPRFWQMESARLCDVFPELREDLTDPLWTNCLEILRDLIPLFGLKSYLELSPAGRSLMASIPLDDKLHVDCREEPVDPGTPSAQDHFFRTNRRTYDLIFVDGEHTSARVEHDLENSLACLASGGVIVTHNLNPSTEAMQAVPRIQKEWTGDAWRAWIKIRHRRPEMAMLVIDSDYGIGILLPGRAPLDGSLPPPAEVSWPEFRENRRALLPLLTAAEAESRLSSYAPATRSLA